MANEGMKISQLPAASEVLDSDVVAGVGGGVTRKFTFATIASYIRTKLSAFFDAKQDKITANGVLQGDGNGGVTARSVDATPTASSTNLVTSGGVKSAIDAVGGFAQVTAITSNSDLNNFTTPGVYYCTNSTVAATLSNTPISNAGFELTVAPSDSSGVIQLIYNSVSTVSKLYIRRKNGSTWYPWLSPARITSVTETSLNGVIAGDGSTVSAKVVDTVPNSTHTSNLISSAGVADALPFWNLAVGILPSCDLNDLKTPTIGFLTTDYSYTNSPITWGMFVCLKAVKTGETGDSYGMQYLFGTQGRAYFRYLSGSTVGSWFQFTTTQI